MHVSTREGTELARDFPSAHGGAGKIDSNRLTFKTNGKAGRNKSKKKKPHSSQPQVIFSGGTTEKRGPRGRSEKVKTGAQSAPEKRIRTSRTGSCCEEQAEQKNR